MAGHTLEQAACIAAFAYFTGLADEGEGVLSMSGWMPKKSFSTDSSGVTAEADGKSAAL